MDRWQPTQDELLDAMAAAPDGMCVTDPTGRVLFVNNAFAALCSDNAVALRGRLLPALLAAGPEPDFAAELQRILDQGWGAYEASLIDREGRARRVGVTARVCGHGARCSIIHMMRDITRERRAEDDLRDARQLLQSVVAQSPTAIIGWDIRFRVTEWNHAAVRIFGWEKHEAIGRHARFIVPLPERQQVDGVWNELLRTSGGRRSANDNLRRDGRVIRCDWYNVPVYDDAGRVTGVMSLVEDVTEKQRLQQDREILTRAIDQSDDAFVMTDREGTILYVNKAFEKMTGYALRDVVGRNPRLMQSGLHDSAFYEDMWETITSGRTWRGDLINRRKDGVLYTENMTITAVFGPNGDITNFVAAKRDVTRLRELDERSRQSQKMEAIGRLAGGIAHDFNNMLNVIIGYAEMASEALPPNHPVAADIREIERAAQRSADLTRQLLTFSRKQVIEPRPVCLNESVADLAKTLGRLIGEHIALEFHPEPGLWRAMIDPAQVDQILANLAANARDAMPRGGHLVIRTANRSVDEEFCEAHLGLEPGQYVHLSVSDDGMGMDERTSRHIFEPFYTTKIAGKGTGLGLATVKGIVDQNGGYIDLDSAPGRGATFNILLPRTLVEPAIEAVPELPVNLSEGGTVLLVEDDDRLRELTGALLAKFGFTVLSAATPLAALQVYQKNPDAFRLLVTDIVMPGMNGRELHECLAELRPGLRAVFMSGYAEQGIIDPGSLKPGLAFLPKPFHRADLERAIRSALGAAVAEHPRRAAGGD
ncbi:MAG: PAS domain S-box protein [bacterium]|jgi:PAS domain S-box-containing protein|nr:PAS domain S-box protein [bacterium]MBK9775922.1 PAS domain S-box protein [bacterium]